MAAIISRPPGALGRRSAGGLQSLEPASVDISGLTVRIVGAFAHVGGPVLILFTRPRVPQPLARCAGVVAGWRCSRSRHAGARARYPTRLARSAKTARSC